jgi:hypothetical protein
MTSGTMPWVLTSCSRRAIAGGVSLDGESADGKSIDGKDEGEDVKDEAGPGEAGNDDGQDGCRDPVEKVDPENDGGIAGADMLEGGKEACVNTGAIGN